MSSFIEENSNSLAKEMDDIIKQNILSTISSRLGISSTSSYANQLKFFSYICKGCKIYPKISFLCEEEVKIKCGCGIKKISIIEYKESLGYFEEDIKCQCGGKFVCYCLNCEKDICKKCKENEHEDHNIKDYEIIEKEDNIQELKEYIGKEINSKIEEKIDPHFIKKAKDEIIKQNQQIKENFRFDYLDFYNNNFGEFEIPPYISLINIILHEINKREPNYSHFSNIKSIHLFLKIQKKNRFIIEYKFSGKGEIKIFGTNFVNNNKINCEIVVNQEIEELKDTLTLNQDEPNLRIILFENNTVKNMSELFNDCDRLVSISEKSKWDTKKVKYMNQMFNNCKSLIYFPEIEGWDTRNVLNMEGMFNGCCLLKEIKGLSKWKTNNITNMKNLFKKCGLLEEIEGISKWETNELIDISGIFCKCSELKSLPDISKWKTNNIINMEKMFKDCKKLDHLPDISKWDVSEVMNFSKIFDKCKSLKTLPDLSKWSPKEEAKKEKMFSKCKSLEYLPHISNWFIEEDNLIDGCSSLKNKPRYDNGRYIFEDNN